MKTSLKAIIVLALSSFTLLNYSATIQVSAPNNLYTFVNSMNDGDIIELTTSGGNYLWTGQVTVSVEKAITIRAKSSLTTRPIVAFSGTTGSFIRYNSTSASWTSKKWTFEGIEFDGFNAASSFYANGFFVQNITNLAYGINVDVKNCVFKNIGARTFTYQGGGAPSNATTAQGGDITIRDSEFRNIFQGVLSANSTLTYNPDNMTFWNCLFVGPGINGNNIRFIETSRPEYNSYQIDHCTFVNSNQRELYLPNTQSTSYIRNSLFVNGYNTTSTNNYNVQIGADCGIYYTAPGGNRTTIYPFSTAARIVNPVLDNVTGIATATTYRTGTTDGLPTGFFGNQIICTETELTDLSYTGGAGPSATKLFYLSATRLTNNISIAAPANSETKGAHALGRISRVITHHKPSPRRRAASTYSITVRFMPKARAKRNTREESSTAIVKISTGMLEPKTPKIISAKIKLGIDNFTSTKRVKKVSTQLPTTALTNPAKIPIKKDRLVIARATPMVMRAPYMIRVSMSRPI